MLPTDRNIKRVDLNAICKQNQDFLAYKAAFVVYIEISKNLRLHHKKNITRVMQSVTK